MNRLGGAALGLVLYLLLCSSVLYYIDPVLEIGFKETKDNSKILPILNQSAEYIKNSIFEKYFENDNSTFHSVFFVSNFYT